MSASVLISPVTGKPLATPSPIPANTTRGEFDAAVVLARRAFHTWRRVPATERQRLMLALADRLESRLQEYARWETENTGKPIDQSIGEMEYCVVLLRHFAGVCTTVLVGRAHYAHYAHMHSQYTRPEPMGVAGIIASFNYPLMLALWKIGPALAAGCSVVFKPAPQTPITIWELVRDMESISGFPKGLVVVTPGGIEVGQWICSHDLINRVGFTGSTPTGRKVMEACVQANALKPVGAEMGGKSAVLVFPDCDLDATVEWIVRAGMNNAGQNCACGSRVYIHADIYEDIIRRYQTKMSQVKVGIDEGCHYGSVVDANQCKRVLGFIERAKADGLKLICGGEQLPRPGYFIAPTAFRDVPDTAELAREEVFGPVQAFMTPFRTLREAIGRANRHKFALCGGVFTRSEATVQRCVEELRAGTVWINGWDQNDPWTEFGGPGESGNGSRDLGVAGLEEFLDWKVVHVFRPDGPGQDREEQEAVSWWQDGEGEVKSRL